MAAVDLDGTALHSDGRVSEENVKALKEWIDAKRLAVVASGRVHGWIPKEILTLGIPYVITGNGSAVIETQTGTYLYEREIPLNRGLNLLDELLDQRGQCYVHVKDRYLEDDARSAEMEQYHPYMLSLGVPRNHRLKEFREEISRLGQDIQKIGFMAFDQETQNRVLARSADFPDFSVLSTGRLCLEFNRKGTSKGEALKYLSHYLNIHMNHVMAIGDSENDLEMISCAGLGIAMGNAFDSVKKEADFVTGTNDEDGLAAAIRQILRETKGQAD